MQSRRRSWSESGAPMWKSSPQFPAADCGPRRFLQSCAHYARWLRKYEQNGSRVRCSRLSLGQSNPPAENQRSRCALPAGSRPIGLAVTNRGTRAIIILTCSVACRGPRNTKRVPIFPASLNTPRNAGRQINLSEIPSCPKSSVARSGDLAICTWQLLDAEQPGP